MEQNLTRCCIFVLQHNGIIENFVPLRESLKRKGYTFYSETDTEVLVKLIEDVKKKSNLSLEEAVRYALTQVRLCIWYN